MVGLLACATPEANFRQELLADDAPAEVAILSIENRAEAALDSAALREALASAAVEHGFSPLARSFVDQQSIDLDLPAVEAAGVLRVRVLDWQVAQQPLRVLGRVHVSLYESGKRLADLQCELDLGLDATDPGGSMAARMSRLRLAVARQIWAAMPAPRDEESAADGW